MTSSTLHYFLKGLRNGLNVTRRYARLIFVGLWLVPLRVAPRIHSLGVDFYELEAVSVWIKFFILFFLNFYFKVCELMFYVFMLMLCLL